VTNCCEYSDGPMRSVKRAYRLDQQVRCYILRESCMLYAIEAG